MNRLLIILFFCIVFFDASCGQKTKEKLTITTKTIDSSQKPLKDSAFLNQYVRLYGDSILTFVVSLSNDRNFLKLIGDSSVFGYGKFAKPENKIFFPASSLGWTSDFEHIFTSGQIVELDSIISRFEMETQNEIAIVTIDSSSTTKEAFDNLILTIANKWGVGKKGLNNGITIGISKGLRKIRICNGYGIEEKFTDADTKKVMDDIMIPEFKKGEYFVGTKNGLLALIEKIR